MPFQGSITWLKWPAWLLAQISHPTHTTHWTHLYNSPNCSHKFLSLLLQITWPTYTTRITTGMAHVGHSYDYSPGLITQLTQSNQTTHLAWLCGCLLKPPAWFPTQISQPTHVTSPIMLCAIYAHYKPNWKSCPIIHLGCHISNELSYIYMLYFPVHLVVWTHFIWSLHTTTYFTIEHRPTPIQVKFSFTTLSHDLLLQLGPHMTTLSNNSHNSTCCNALTQHNICDIVFANCLMGMSPMVGPLVKGVPNSES